MNLGDPLRCHLVLPCLSVTMSRDKHQPQPEKGLLSKVQIALGMKVWVIPPSEPPRPTKEIPEGEKN